MPRAELRPVSPFVDGITPVGDRKVGRSLTARQLEVLRCVGMGLTGAQTAEALSISIHTVHDYLRSGGYMSIYDRLGANNNINAVIIALDRGELNLAEMTDGFDFSRFERLTRRQTRLTHLTT